MFQIRGQFDLKMDSKGRLPLPVRLREALDAAGENRLVLAYWDGGLQGFTETRWRKMERRFAGQSLFDRKTRAFLHAYVAAACEVEPDAQGRILVPVPLRKRATLRSDCVVLSYLGLLEIWDAERWAARQEAALAQVEQEGEFGILSTFDADDEGEDL